MFDCGIVSCRLWKQYNDLSNFNQFARYASRLQLHDCMLDDGMHASRLHDPDFRKSFFESFLSTLVAPAEQSQPLEYFVFQNISSHIIACYIKAFVFVNWKIVFYFMNFNSKM